MEKQDARVNSAVAADQANNASCTKIGAIGCGAVLAFAILMTACSSLLGGNNDGPDEGSAKVLCKDVVEENLKNPRSADFGSVEVKKVSPESFEVTGVVRGENSFGGTASHSFTCSATWEENGKWDIRARFTN